MQDLFLITPPFTQLNTPYPATAYIKGFLNTKGISSYQMDLGIEVILALFTRDKLAEVFQYANERNTILSDNAIRIYTLRKEYLDKIDRVISFLQGKNLSFARQICSDQYLPKAKRFAQLDDLEWAFGNMGIQDKAKHLATLFIEDVSDFIVECVDENFGFSRYAERLGMSANSFDEIHDELMTELSFVDQITLEILADKITKTQVKLVCFSVPFPGNLFSALRCAQYVKNNHPDIKIVMGGGFASTELRSITDVRVFDFFDFICLDDGELPLELVVSNVLDPSPENPNHNLFKRTFVLENEKVVYNNFSLRKDYPQKELGTPDYSDLFLDQYISVIEIANPMHSLWSDGRWNKLTMAHGCYWGKCTFCDVSLDYIKKYEPIASKLMVDRMEELIAQTGETGFHFVDEAAPPALMRGLAIEIIKRGLSVSWWTNIRFEKRFDHDLCRLLKASGCIAISGGLEVASDRLLALIDKGVSIQQVAKVTQSFRDVGIMVHAYLMYGYPSQTVQETVDSLEVVRQLFELDVLQSGYWHQFALTAHSPIGLEPEKYGIIPVINEITFANNDVPFEDKTGIDHSLFSYGLKKSLYNFMHGIGFEFPLQDWFDFNIPDTDIHPNLIEKAISEDPPLITKETAKLFWIGNMPSTRIVTKKKRGVVIEMIEMTIYDNSSSENVQISVDKGLWLLKNLVEMQENKTLLSFKEFKSDFRNSFPDFDMFWYSETMDVIRWKGLLVL